MSYLDGLQALSLKMPDRVPRTEYSVEMHYPLQAAVTGLPVGPASDFALQTLARRKFYDAWQIDLVWNILINSAEFGEARTKMGHAVYAADASDYDTSVSALLEDPEDVYALDLEAAYPPPDHKQLVRRFSDHYRQAVTANPDCVNMTGIYITCMSGLIDLLGWDMLLTAAGADPVRFGRFAQRYSRWIGHYFAALAESEAPVVMIHDDIVWTGGPFIHPDWYRQHLFPSYRENFRSLLEAGKKILYTSDGDYSLFFDDIIQSGVHGVVMEPMTDMAAFAERYGKDHVFIGNADTRILLSGSKEDIYAEVKRCMDIGKKYPGFFLAVGNHIPPNTPVESCLWYNEAYEKMSRR